MYITKENFRHNNINFIQFVMAILVIYSHAFPIATAANAGEIIKDLTASAYSFGNLAVATFFIFSGFLVSASYESTPNIFIFLKKRCFRIFPGLFAVLVFSTFVLGPCITTLPITEYFRHPVTWQYLKSIFLKPLYWNLPGVFESNLYGTSVNGSLWTIPYQFGFYLLLGVLGFLGLTKQSGMNLALFGIFTISYLLKDNLFPGITHLAGMPFADWLYLGMYFTAGMVAYSYKHIIRLTRQGAMISLFLLILAWAAKEYFVSTTIFGTYLLLYLAYCTRSIHFSLARLSFGIYLYGFPVQQFFTHLSGGVMNPYLNTVLSIPTVILLAWLSDRFIERPIQKIEKYITIKRYIPEKVIEIWEKCCKGLMKFADCITHVSWKTYFSMLLIVWIIYWFLFVNLPSSVRFGVFDIIPPRAVGVGYHSKSKGENFTFVSDDSTIYLGQNRGMTQLSVNGFVPDTFTDIHHVSIYVNNEVYAENAEVAAGESFAFEFSIPDNPASTEKQIAVQLVFNAVHELEPDSMDVRDLSACISSVSLERAGMRF